MDKKELDALSIATIRSTVIDETNKAKSGHPGMALGSAPILYVLYKNHLIASPKEPLWVNRDRFLMSSGHVSALLYVMLHLSGYKVSLDDLKSFRQLGSLTPGHPEYLHTAGVDSTSGPLGQGIAQAVGVAMAEQAVAAQYPEGNKIMSHYTYCLCGDGCLEEGLSQEAISLAGHQKLNKLILIYDANNVTLDGSFELSSSENVKMRFMASNWNVLEVMDGNDIEKIDKAIKKAKKSEDKPTLIVVHTIIGYGSEKQGTSKTHGAPLGVEDGKKAKLSYGFDHEDFYIPQEVYDNFKKTFVKRGKKALKEYKAVVKEYSEKYPEEYKVFLKAFSGNLDDYHLEAPAYEEGYNKATRNVSGEIINKLHQDIPFVMGGSADVAGSVMTKLNGGSDFTPINRAGRNINYGIREFEMASAINGILLHGGLKTYGGSFMVFSDYFKSAIRMSALTKLPAIYLLSHDSIAVGEDGPTHQPIDQLPMLRSIPNCNVIRPCDRTETYAAWEIALHSKTTPTCIILSRQGLPLLKNSSFEGASKGAYVVSRENAKLDGIIIATGSEVSLAIEAQNKLLSEGIDVRVVSMPSTFIFDNQSEKYKKEILPLKKDKIISCEMGSTITWYKYAGTTMGIDTFGTSAPAKDAIAYFNFTSDRLVNLVKETLK